MACCGGRALGGTVAAISRCAHVARRNSQGPPCEAMDRYLVPAPQITDHLAQSHKLKIMLREPIVMAFARLERVQ
jgi:hypothetical protein